MQYRFIAILGSVAAGFVLGVAWHSGHQPGSPIEQSRAIAQNALLSRTSSAPMLVVEPDGLITGHFDHVGRDWLVAALRTTSVDTSIAPSSSGPVLDEAITDPSAKAFTVDEAVTALRNGSEPEQFDALTRAVQAGLDTDLPPRVLAATFQAGASDRLAMLAFSTYVDAVANDRDKARAAIGLGMESSSASVREDAARRMAELDRVVANEARSTDQGFSN